MLRKTQLSQAQRLRPCGAGGQAKPPGDYLVAALDYVQDGMWNDPEYLESIRRYAERMTLKEGESRSISLKLASP